MMGTTAHGLRTTTNDPRIAYEQKPMTKKGRTGVVAEPQFVNEPGYKKLEIWQLGIEIVKRVYLIAQSLPREEAYGLVSQIKRAAVSVPSNIAEGNSRRNAKEFQQYLHIALGSLAELETQLVICKEVFRIPNIEILGDIENIISKERAMILNLIKSLNLRGPWNVDRGSRRAS